MTLYSRGLTLIEVVAALAILGSVLAGLIMARGRFVQQHQRARHRLAAIPIADQLLEAWWRKPDLMPRSGEGYQDGYDWRIRTRQDKQTEAWGVRIARLDLWYRESSASPHASATAEPEPELSVEFLIFEPPEPPENEVAAGENS